MKEKKEHFSSKLNYFLKISDGDEKQTGKKVDLLKRK